MTDRAMFVPPSRAFVFDVTALAPSTMATTPSTPTRRMKMATITSTRVKPRWSRVHGRTFIRFPIGFLRGLLEGVRWLWPYVRDPQKGPRTDEGRARRPALVEYSVRLRLYQRPSSGQPPWPPVVQVRSTGPP